MRDLGRRTMKIFAQCLLLIALNATVVYSRNLNRSIDYSPLIEKYRKILAEEMLKYHDAGMSIALVDGDSVVWCEGFGYYNSKEKYKVSGHTPFNIGSICKTFTGLAVLQLQEDHAINIDQSFKKYVPAFHPPSNFGSVDQITVRHILTHHAGIPDYIKDKFDTVPGNYTGVLDMVNRDYMTSPPNTVFSYSNAGFSILGNLIESVSGQSYYQFVQNRILTPMQMTETGFVKDNHVPESVLLGYSTNGQECKELAVYDAPAGCIYSTAHDMAKYIQTYLNWGKYKGTHVFDPATLKQMMEVQNQDVFLDFGSPYGLAWRVYYNDGGTSIQHDGGTMYHRAEVSISPYAGIGVVMLSNSASGKPLLHNDYDIMNEAIRIKGYQSNEKVTIPVKNSRHPEHNFKYTTEAASPVSFTNKDKEELARYAGKYGSFGMLYSVVADSGALLVDMGSIKFYLLPVNNNEFVPAGQNNKNTINPTNRFYFEKYNEDLLMIQTDQWGNHNMMSQKIQEKPLDAAWTSRLGRYDRDGSSAYQMFSDFSIENRDGIICLVCKFNMEMPGVDNTVLVAPLKILSENLAIVYGYGRFSGQAVQFAKGHNNKEEMHFMGFTCNIVK